MNGKVINYFIASSFNGKSPKCFKSPLTINNKVAIDLLRKQFGKGIRSPLMHVCFDISSERIYVLNSSDFSNSDFEDLLTVAKLRILKDYGNYKLNVVIKGSPYSSFRIRCIKDFHYANEIIDTPIPIIEANLDRMPTTLTQLPSVYGEHRDFMGGYVDKTVEFIDEIDDDGNKRVSGVLLERQESPFILINISGQSNPSPIEKEHIILSGYRDFLAHNQVSFDGVEAYADLYAIKSHLCLGWSFEEISSFLLRDIKDFGELVNKIQRLLETTDSLIEDGYKNVASNPYYMFFEMTEKFPLKLSNIMDDTWTKVKDEFQIKGLEIIDIDNKNGFVTIKTPAFIPPSICSDVFKTESDVFIYQYNPIVNNIDIKTHICKNKLQHKKVVDRIKSDSKIDSNIKCRYNSSSRGEWAVNPNIFNIKRVSDYLYGYNFIRKQCDKGDIPFKDLDVIVGPIEKFMGRGSQGGFVSDQLLESKDIKLPYKLEDGIELMPPAILINSITEPSSIEQMSTLLHEYRHYVYSRVNMYHKNEYGNMHGKKGDAYLEEWSKYLSDPNEVEAHMEEIEFELLVGKNEDEIIRDKVGGAITLHNYPIAMKFKELVDKVLENKERKNEECSRTS